MFVFKHELHEITSKMVNVKDTSMIVSVIMEKHRSKINVTCCLAWKKY